MEFLDEDARPRFLLKSRPLPPSSAESDPSPHSILKPTLFISIPLATLLFAISLLYFTSEPIRSILIWLSFSFLLGPFAPPSLTAGDIRVGLGPPLQDPPPSLTESETPNNKKPNRKSAKPRKESDDSVSNSGSFLPGYPLEKQRIDGSVVNSEKGDSEVENQEAEEKDWNDGDVELLRKLMGKNPVGKPGRWEAIAEGFKGRHKVESVIRKAKETGEKKVGNDDSYQKFLKDRKQVDKRIEDNVEEKREIGWSSGEDLALLNALRAFPKDAPMRWEKITAAVPGKTKAACMKRVTDLKKDFRSSKAPSNDA